MQFSRSTPHHGILFVYPSPSSYLVLSRITCPPTYSIVAPHQTSVDLNVVQQPAPTDTQHRHPTGTAGSPPPRTRTPPPNLTDLGACLWGPPQMPNVGRSSPARGPAAPGSEGRRGDKSHRDRPTLEKGGAPQAGDDPEPAPRPVLFAYVAQPGGRLWRIGLSDGEVESMHRPRVEVDEEREREEGAGLAGGLGGGVELGYLRAVDVGDARVRHGEGREREGRKGERAGLAAPVRRDSRGFVKYGLAERQADHCRARARFSRSPPSGKVVPTHYGSPRRCFRCSCRRRSFSPLTPRPRVGLTVSPSRLRFSFLLPPCTRHPGTLYHH